MGIFLRSILLTFLVGLAVRAQACQKFEGVYYMTGSSFSQAYAVFQQQGCSARFFFLYYQDSGLGGGGYKVSEKCSLVNLDKTDKLGRVRVSSLFAKMIPNTVTKEDLLQLSDNEGRVINAKKTPLQSPISPENCQPAQIIP